MFKRKRLIRKLLKRRENQINLEKFATLTIEQRNFLESKVRYKFIDRIPPGARRRFWFKILPGNYVKNKLNSRLYFDDEEPPPVLIWRLLHQAQDVRVSFPTNIFNYESRIETAKSWQEESK